MSLLEKSSQDTSSQNIRYIRELILKHFYQKASRESIYWKDSQYIENGSEDATYIENLKTALSTRNDWQGFANTLAASYEAFLNPPVVETPAEEGVPVASETETTTQDASNDSPTDTVTDETTKTTTGTQINSETTSVEEGSNISVEPPQTPTE